MNNSSSFASAVAGWDDLDLNLNLNLNRPWGGGGGDADDDDNNVLSPNAQWNKRGFLQTVRRLLPRQENLSMLTTAAGSTHASCFVDSVAQCIASRLGWVVALQSVLTVLTANNNHVFHEIVSQFLSEDGQAAIVKIREILEKAYDDGWTDVFTKYRLSELLTSIYALGRLQHACRWYELQQQQQQQQEGQQLNRNTQEQQQHHPPDLLDNLAHYAVYANAAYGWIMDLASFHGDFHLGGNLMNLRMRTKVPKGDILAANWEPKRNHPGYFIVRDRMRKKIVLCVRGTWSAQDVLNDLCCEPDTLEMTTGSTTTTTTCEQSSGIWGTASHGKTKPGMIRAHHGMLKAARYLKDEVETLLTKEFEERPDYSLVLVGHSMGGGVAALLGILWDTQFPGLVVYVIGAPCVVTRTTNNNSTQHDHSSTTLSSCSATIISVVHDLDPFSRLSLGHVADLSTGLSILCSDVDLRKEILQRARGPVARMNQEDLRWCHQTMTQLRSQLNSEKLYPPGRVLLLSVDHHSNQQQQQQQHSPNERWNLNRPSLPITLREVNVEEHFQDLLIRPRMFDLTRHAPVHYIYCLKKLAEHFKLSKSSQ